MTPRMQKLHDDLGRYEHAIYECQVIIDMKMEELSRLKFEYRECKDEIDEYYEDLNRAEELESGGGY